MTRFVSLLLPIALCVAVTQDAAAQSLLDRLGGLLPQGEESQEESAAPPITASPRVKGPGYLGLTGDDAEGDGGVVVIDVEKDTAAARAGFQPGDLIVSIGGTEITGMKDMARLLQRRKAGEKVEFVVVREDGEKKITATLAAGRPATGPAAEEELPPSEIRSRDSAGPVLGVTVAPITDELRDRYGFSVEEGAVIAAIEPGTPAHRQRLPIGGVIVDVNGQAIKNAEDLQEIVASSHEGDELELVYYIGKQRYRTKLRLAPPMAEPRVAEPRPVPTPSNPRGSDLERRLGNDGRRPILGRIGRVLDDIDEFVDDQPPANPEPDRGPTRAAAAEEEVAPERESQMLRDEIELLRREISLLRRRVDELERRLKE